MLRETEYILFNYFRHIKACKYFLKKSTSQSSMNSYEIIDISNILNNVPFTENEQFVVIKYCNRLSAPKLKGTKDYQDWITAMHKIRDEFLYRGVIQCN